MTIEPATAADASAALVAAARDGLSVSIGREGGDVVLSTARLDRILASATRFDRAPRPAPSFAARPGPQPDPAELPHVAVPQLAAVSEREGDPHVRIRGRSPGDDEECAGHPQRDRHHASVVEMEEDRLRSPVDAADRRASDFGDESLGRLRMADRAIPADGRLADRRPGDDALEVARDGLDFGELRHDRSVSDSRDRVHCRHQPRPYPSIDVLSDLWNGQ